MKKTRLKMKNRSHRFDINRPKSRHGNKYILNIKCVTVPWWLTIFFKQHLSNIWSSIHEKGKQHCS